MIAAADQVCEHTFDLLGSGPTYLGESIDWHVDFKTGHRFDPCQYYADVRRSSFPGGYDILVPWNLSCCRHFGWLGQAYWATGDEKYVREYMAQTLDWIQKNRPEFGVNWACTMMVAIRAVNWLWAYHFFKDSPSLTNEFRLEFFRSLLVHGRHIINNLECSETLTGNHYLADIVGLAYLGILLPEFKEAERWREFALQELEKEMFKQVYPDGVDFEASVSYHRLVTEMFLSATLLARLSGHVFGDAFMDRLDRMLEFTMCVTKPDGTVPLIGDSDNGRLHRLKVWESPEREWVDHRYLLAIGAVLFERTDFAQAAGDQWEEAIWLYGEKAVAYKRQVDATTLPPMHKESRAFPDAGLYVMRHDDLYVIVSAGPAGQKGRGGHAHNDVLSFELYANGQSWIVDPGTYVYTQEYDARHQFRSTAYHNTLVVDGEEQADLDPREPFVLRRRNDARVLEWTVSDDTAILDCEYASGRGWAHRRRVRVLQETQGVVISDTVTGSGERSVVASFHAAPLVEVTRAGDRAVLFRSSRGGYAALLQTADCEGEFELDTGWVSRSYGQKSEASIIRYRVHSSLPIHFEWVFAFGETEHEALVQGRTLAASPIKEISGAASSCGTHPV